MSLPPALLARLAQRGLVQKPKAPEPQIAPSENEEVIAEDYDEMDSDDKNAAEEYQNPPQYDHDDGTTRKRTEDNFWLERMRARMGEASSYAGYKGCPNKYNIWHKCTLFCVNRWADGATEPSREYMRRYKRLLRKYPLPKGWIELYDPGCASYYFYSAADNLVSWLPPTHPKSNLTKSAATLRRKLEETGDPEGGGADDSDYNTDEEEESIENSETRHKNEIDDIISNSMRVRTPPNTTPTLAPHEFPPLQEVTAATNSQPPRKQKTRDIERALSRQKRDKYERSTSSNSRRRGQRGDDVLDPMDPSAYSDTPRGKWSDGLQSESDRKKSNEIPISEREPKSKRDEHSDDDEDDVDDNDEDDPRNYE